MLTGVLGTLALQVGDEDAVGQAQRTRGQVLQIGGRLPEKGIQQARRVRRLVAIQCDCQAALAHLEEDNVGGGGAEDYRRIMASSTSPLDGVAHNMNMLDSALSAELLALRG